MVTKRAGPSALSRPASTPRSGQPGSASVASGAVVGPSHSAPPSAASTPRPGPHPAPLGRPAGPPAVSTSGAGGTSLAEPPPAKLGRVGAAGRGLRVGASPVHEPLHHPRPGAAPLDSEQLLAPRVTETAGLSTSLSLDALPPSPATPAHLPRPSTSTPRQRSRVRSRCPAPRFGPPGDLTAGPIDRRPAMADDATVRRAGAVGRPAGHPAPAAAGTRLLSCCCAR